MRWVQARRASLPHSTQRVLHLDDAELLVGVGLYLFKQLSLCGQNLLEGLLEIRLGRRRVAA